MTRHLAQLEKSRDFSISMVIPRTIPSANRASTGQAPARGPQQLRLLLVPRLSPTLDDSLSPFYFVSLSLSLSFSLLARRMTKHDWRKWNLVGEHAPSQHSQKTPKLRLLAWRRPKRHGGDVWAMASRSSFEHFPSDLAVGLRWFHLLSTIHDLTFPSIPRSTIESWWKIFSFFMQSEPLELDLGMVI